MKLITTENLSYLVRKIGELFVKKELKTGSTTEYKQLSDHNLTDELVAKINAAGVATEVTEDIANAKSEAIQSSNSYTDAEVADALAEAKEYADQAEEDAIASSKAYTDEEVASSLAEAKAYADQAESDAVSEAKSYADAEIADALAEAKAYADQSEADAVAAAKSYTDGQTAEAKEYADQSEADAVAAAKTYTDEQIAEAKGYADQAEADAVASSNTYTDTQVSAAKTELTNAINGKISSAYKAKGSTVFANLPALSETEEGNVYNVTDAFTTTDDFVEGKGQKHAAGANVVCIEVSDGVFKWDVLEGFIDTSVFVKHSDIETVTEAEIDAMFAA